MLTRYDVLLGKGRNKEALCKQAGEKSIKDQNLMESIS